MLFAQLFGSANAAAALAPRDGLRQALRDVHALAEQATARRAGAAATALGHATVAGLWINSREADAPPYGRNVFTSSAQAVEDLAGVTAPDARTAVNRIVLADRRLVEDTIDEADGGTAAARQAVRAGDRA